MEDAITAALEAGDGCDGKLFGWEVEAGRRVGWYVRDSSGGGSAMVHPKRAFWDAIAAHWEGDGCPRHIGKALETYLNNNCNGWEYTRPDNKRMSGVRVPVMCTPLSPISALMDISMMDFSFDGSAMDGSFVLPAAADEQKDIDHSRGRYDSHVTELAEASGGCNLGASVSTAVDCDFGLHDQRAGCNNTGVLRKLFGSIPR